LKTSLASSSRSCQHKACCYCFLINCISTGRLESETYLHQSIHQFSDQLVCCKCNDDKPRENLMKGNIGNILLLADQRTAGCWFYLCFTLVCAHSVSAQSSSALPLLSASAPVEPNDIKHSINIPIYQVAMAQLPDVVEQQAGAVGSRLVPLRQCRTYRPPLASVLQVKC